MKRFGELANLIASEQQRDGSFMSYSVALGAVFGSDSKTYQTTFMTALILGAIAGIDDETLEVVQQRAADWLLAQRGPEWSFNYWSHEEPEVKVRSYPDDWDDTSCAISALSRVRPEVITGGVLGHIVKLLTGTEEQEGGPYRTWIVGEEAPKHWHDVDIAVNANIAYLLKLHEVQLPNLETLVDTRIAAGELVSPYYPTSAPIEYFVSRWYRGARWEQLRERILARKRRGRWGGALETALAVSSLLNLGAEPDGVAGAVKWLRNLEPAELKAGAFCMDPATEGKPYVAGARALTAALVMEAIWNYDQAIKRAEGSLKHEVGTSANKLDELIVQTVMARFEQAGKTVYADAQTMKDRLLGGTAAAQITALPFLFRRALGRRGANITDKQVVLWGMVSFYGWIAYTVYDDFLDEEGKPQLLPVANVALRELVLLVQHEANRVDGLGEIAWGVLDGQEAANAWEVTYCRVARQSDLRRVAVPDFGNLAALAERSMGHALGCVALTLALGYAPTSMEVKTVRSFFYHFLIARQLGDDLADWKVDLEKGQINAVGAWLLSEAGQQDESVAKLYHRLERILWEKTAVAVKQRMTLELNEARAQLKHMNFIEEPKILLGLLAPIEADIEATERKRQQTAEFLQSYEAKNL